MAMFKNRSRKTVTLIVAGGLTLAGTGVAFAYWTSTGTGTGTATTAENIDFVVTSDAPAGAALTPGGGSQTVNFRVHNPSSGNQQLSGVTVAVLANNGTEWTAVAGCSAADYTVVITSTTPATPTVLTPESGTVTTDDATGVATISMINDPDRNQDGCQAATVPLYFVASQLD